MFPIKQTKQVLAFWQIAIRCSSPSEPIIIWKSICTFLAMRSERKHNHIVDSSENSDRSWFRSELSSRFCLKHEVLRPSWQAYPPQTLEAFPIVLTLGCLFQNVKWLNKALSVMNICTVGSDRSGRIDSLSLRSDHHDQLKVFNILYLKLK